MENSLDGKQVLSVIERYSTALDLLDSYDHYGSGVIAGRERNDDKCYYELY